MKVKHLIISIFYFSLLFNLWSSGEDDFISITQKFNKTS